MKFLFLCVNSFNNNNNNNNNDNNNQCLNRVTPLVTGLVSTGALYNVKIKRVCKNNIYP